MPDPERNPVELTHERWDHIVDPVRGHPEMAPCLGHILRAVEAPDLRRKGRRPGEVWHFLEGVGPSRWLHVVVAYECRVGRIITAFPRRRLPR